MLGTVIATEVLKLRRSKVTWYTLAAISMAPLGLALFMWIVREPGRAAQLGLLGTKANLSGLEATWPAYTSALILIVGILGMLLLSFIVAYVFGREYQDEMAKNLLALPVGRHWFVVAKLVVAALWWLALVVAVLLEAFVIGVALGLPGYSTGLLMSSAGSALLAAGISFMVVPVVAWVTVLGRGYMAPIGFAIAMMALGNLFGRTGWAPWFPWSIVPLLVGMVGSATEAPPAGSYIVLGVTFLSGVAATMLQLRYSDNTQ